MQAMPHNAMRRRRDHVAYTACSSNATRMLWTRDQETKRGEVLRCVRKQRYVVTPCVGSVVPWLMWQLVGWNHSVTHRHRLRPCGIAHTLKSQRCDASDGVTPMWHHSIKLHAVARRRRRFNAHVDAKHRLVWHRSYTGIIGSINQNCFFDFN